MRFIVVKEQIRRKAKEEDMEVTNDVFKELDYKVREMLRDAIDRAKSNKRSTVMGRDV